MRHLLIIMVVLFVAGILSSELPALKAKVTEVSTSGISAGGAMALQLATAFSANISGVGAIAGPPFHCADGTLSTAMLSCMYGTMPVDVSALAGYIEAQAKSGGVDATANLHTQRIWLYSGSSDSVVRPSVVKAGADLSRKFSSHVVLVDSVPSEHAWITNNYGSSCATLGSPYINNCNLEAAKEILAHVYGADGPLRAPVSNAMDNGTLETFDQSRYVQGGASPSALSLGPTGYVYVPHACRAAAGCRVHVALHGCSMDLASIGTKFIDHSGLIELAASNRIVVLFPQVQKSTFLPQNPEACFDWWGYTDSSYALKDGAQMSTIMNMVHALQM